MKTYVSLYSLYILSIFHIMFFAQMPTCALQPLKRMILIDLKWTFVFNVLSNLHYFV
ncbi:hypothetical protein SAMN05444267_1001201 [Chryseobacterium polytrichastri]|uniref:Uncharacterized protein n=1 Tax=Chryseobacterium polytrichastri TaxID=1302687 RepID=A0A1M6Q370_9FLAO|nr:hypothetical protein SAMN05444267_1001201 [Chryseobacterium polytrichastri]